MLEPYLDVSPGFNLKVVMSIPDLFQMEDPPPPMGSLLTLSAPQWPLSFLHRQGNEEIEEWIAWRLEEASVEKRAFNMQQIQALDLQLLKEYIVLPLPL